MAIVYHVHLPNNTDLSDGYIGVTSRTIADRRATHKNNAFSKMLDYKVYVNMRMHWEILVWEIIFEGSRAECNEYEKELRPVKNVGWNTDVGGGNKKGIRQDHSEWARKNSNMVLNNPMLNQHSKDKARISQIEFLSKNANSAEGKNYYLGKTTEERNIIAEKKAKTFSEKSDADKQIIGKRRSGGRKVEIDGVVYKSMSDASRALGIHVPTISKRIKSKLYPNYKDHDC